MQLKPNEKFVIIVEEDAVVHAIRFKLNNATTIVKKSKRLSLIPKKTKTIHTLIGTNFDSIPHKVIIKIYRPNNILKFVEIFTIDPQHSLRYEPATGFRLYNETTKMFYLTGGPLVKAGPTGKAGKPGPQGFIGTSGTDGTHGKAGEQGPAGVGGEQGLKGDTGEKGDKGDHGDQGTPGPVGFKGEDGEQGIVGAPGLDGQDGLDGDKGDQGEQGPVGDKGDRGDPGLSGIPGIDGTAGADGRFIWRGDWRNGTKYSIDDVVQFDGSSWISTQKNVGVMPQDPSDKWDLVAAKGDEGEQGEAGPRGQRGVGGSNLTVGGGGTGEGDVKTRAQWGGWRG